MEVIKAKVNERLLSKADRLFTGTLDGRMIEILQNARRAGATEVHIINSDGQITVRDNGQGIADFGALLDLGKSGWDDNMENAEDPAGVGVFCLAPREVCIASGHKKAVVQSKGWTGAPVQVLATDESVKGTTLVFQDERKRTTACHTRTGRSPEAQRPTHTAGHGADPVVAGPGHRIPASGPCLLSTWEMNFGDDNSYLDHGGFNCVC